MELTFVGHSLGGSEAALNALVTGQSAITFNPSGLSDITKAINGNLLTPLKNENNINAYIMTTDPLNYLQDRLPIPEANGVRHYVKPADIRSAVNGHCINSMLRSFNINPLLYKK